jgi:APA family basic amino acid/polyamine antiporter
LHSSAITNAADDVTGKTAIELISVGVLALVAGATALSLRSLARVILVLVLLQVLAVAVMAVLFIGHSQSDFASAFARYSDHPGAYGDVLAGAHKSGVLFGTSLAGMLGVVPFMVLSYNGVLYSYYVGGELKRPNRTYVSASAISLGLMVVFWVGTWLLMRHTVGLHFMQAQAGMDPAAYDKISSLTPLSGGIGYGMVLSGDPVTKILFATAFPLAQITADLAFITVVTRVLFAAAFDRLLPVGVAKVSERTHAPTVAIAIALVVGAGFAVLTTYVDISNIVANLALFTALIILLASLACTALPFRRPDLILKPGATDVERWMGIPKIALVGLASTVVAAITVGLIIAKPSVFGKFSVVSVMSLVVVFGSGPVIYAISRAVRWRRSSIDLKLALQSLPPE